MPWLSIGSVKLFIGAALATAIFLAVYSYGERRRDDGYNAARAEYQAEIEKQAAQAIAEQEKALQKLRERNAEALEVIKRLRESEPKPEIIEKEIIRYVEKTNCKRLGDDFVRLFNAIHAKTGANNQD